MERVLLGSGPRTTSSAVRLRTELRLRGDAQLREQPGQGLQLAAPQCVLTFAALPPGLRAGLDALAGTDALAGADAPTREELGARVVSDDGISGLMRLQRLLLRLDGEGLLEHTVLVDGTVLLQLFPVGRGRTTWAAAPPPGTPVRLSRFVQVQAEGGRLVARAPGSHAAVGLGAAAAPLLAALAGWSDVAAVAEAAGLAPEATAEALRHLAAAGLLAAGGPDDDPEFEQAEQAQWSAADRWVHTRSRGPRTVAGYGGTYRFADRFAPPPAAPAPRGSTVVALPVPDPTGTGPSLDAVLEGRRSIREHDDEHPITLAQLGELLHRSARQRQTFAGTDGQELADRPYPSGGAVHELELYPLVTRCTGLAAGLYHYRADDHALELVTEPGPATAALVAGARDSAVMTTDPQVVLLISARFGRVMWKYETVPYSLVLKHVGVLYQTLYLVGTAMDLAVCGLGGGDAADFAAATGLDSFAESSVGELVVGSVPDVLVHPYGVPRPDEGAGR